MTVAALTQTRAQIAGDGVTDRVDITFQFVDENDLRVIHTDAEGTDTEWVYGQSPGSWGFTGGGYAAGTVTFTAADLAEGERLTVVATSEYSQPVSFSGGEMDPDVIQKGLDRAALQIQAIAGDVSRALRISPSLEGDLIELEVPDLPEGYGFVREGDALVPVLIDSNLITASVVSAQEAQEAAEEAQSAAESAQNDAETAKTDAVTAKGEAEDAAEEAVLAAASVDADNLAKLGTANTFTADQTINKSEPMRILKDADAAATHKAISDQLINGTYLWQTLDHENNVVSTDFSMTLGASGVSQWLWNIQGATAMTLGNGGLLTISGGFLVGTSSSSNNSFIAFWDEANATRRTVRWNYSTEEFDFEIKGGTFVSLLSIGQDQTWQN
ncbi:MAG: hypothetical protein AAFY24_25015, partial [Pseudomonadota bacterium]